MYAIRSYYGAFVQHDHAISHGIDACKLMGNDDHGGAQAFVEMNDQVVQLG